MTTNKRYLKHFVRYDGSGRLIPGGNILQRNMPKVGKWVESQGYLCCNDCPIVVYGTDIIIENVVYDEAVVTFTFTNDASSAIQVAFIDHNEDILASTTISANSTEDWTFSVTVLMESSNLKFRRVCGGNYSEWVYFFDGEQPN